MRKRTRHIIKFFFILVLAIMAGCQRNSDSVDTGKKEENYYVIRDCGVTELYDLEQQWSSKVPEILNVSGVLLGKMSGCDGSEIYYGQKEDSVFVYNADSQEMKIIEIEDFFVNAYRACIDQDGTMFFCDVNALWKISAQEKLLLCRFRQQDCVIERVDEIKVLADGTIEIKAFMEGMEHLIQCVKTQDVPTDPKEITIALASKDVCIEMAVAEFNRKNEGYRIIIETPQKNEDYSDFRTRIQLEITNGKGPDIVDNSILLNYREYASKRLLDPLSDVMGASSDFIPAALSVGTYLRETYGVPYQCHVVVVAWRKSDLGEKEGLTLNDLIAMLKNNSQRIVGIDGWGEGLTGEDIICEYVLGDKTNNEFIDWEKGISHLNEGTFAELLEFMKGHFPGDSKAGIMENALSVRCTILQRSDLNFLKTFFQGDEVIRGYPSMNGGRNVVLSYLLFLNSNSKNKEMAKNFLRYVQSEEYQMKIADYEMASGAGVSADMPKLPVRWNAIKAWLDHKNNPDYTKVTYFRNGIEFIDSDLTDQQKEYFLVALENADYSEFGTTQIENIIIEELTPFFNGEKSARDVSNVLHNRIQLYLDEKGRE